MKKRIMSLALAALAPSCWLFAQKCFDELPDPAVYSDSAWSSVDGVRAGWGSVYERYSGSIPPALGKEGTSCRLSAWRGEKVSAQFVVWTSKDLDSLEISACDMHSRCGTIPASSVKTGFLRYVMTDELNKDRKGGCGYRVSKDFDSSLVADCVDHIARSMPVKKFTARPVWVSIEVPYDAAPGRYTGKIKVFDGADELSELTLDMTVKTRVLPELKNRRFHLDLWQNPYAVARYHGVEPFSDEHFAFMRPVMERYAAAGGSVITASVTHKPWNGQTYDYFESMVTWLKKADGTWYFDYTVFDKWVEFMFSCGVTGQINCYSMIPWGLSFQYLDQASNSFREIVLKPGEPEYEAFWGPMLRSFAAHLKEKGWFSKTMIAMDERPMDQMLAVMETIKNADPEFKVAFAGAYHDELLDGLDYYCVPVGDSYPDGAVGKRRAEGKITTYYTCCSEPWPNTFTCSRPAEAEWIGWYIAACGLDGYLRWALNSWPECPMQDSRFTAWAAGDTYLIYPEGRTSVRFELLEAGIIAYEKIMMLKDEFAKSGNEKELRKINNVLSKFVIEGDGGIEQVEDLLRDAGKLLERY